MFWTLYAEPKHFGVLYMLNPEYCTSMYAESTCFGCSRLESSVSVCGITPDVGMLYCMLNWSVLVCYILNLSVLSALFRTQVFWVLDISERKCFGCFIPNASILVRCIL